MTIEEIAIRQEVRQMLTEAGINRNSLKQMVKAVLDEEINKACKQALAETDVQGKIDSFLTYGLKSSVKESISDQIRDVIRSRIYNMMISVDISDIDGKFSTLR